MQYTQLSRRSAGGKIDWEKQYLTFIPVEDAIFSWTERAVSGHLEYSVNGGQTWITIANGESTPTITAGSKVVWKGDLVPRLQSSTDVGGIGTFNATVNYKAYGNIMSLLFYDNYYGSQLSSSLKCTFVSLFENDSHILKAPLLPATRMYSYSYNRMFRNCSNLVTAPDLPATTLSDSCYSRMFINCSALTKAPELPATELQNYCYSTMFKGCTSLIYAPELPATKLRVQCYENMFHGCTSLIYAPVLRAAQLPNYSYLRMFQGCTSLSYIKCLATSISAADCTLNWLSDVASTGTFVKAAGMTGWPTGSSGIPSGWTVVDDNS